MAIMFYFWGMSKITKFKSDKSVGSVDKEAGIIYGVAVITGGREALGHESYVDDVMVDQVVALGQEADKGPGLKARFDHPNSCYKSVGTAIGRFKNFRKDGDKAIADLHILDSAAKSPDGDLRTYILELAEEDSEMFATSIVFRPGEDHIESPEDNPDMDENAAFLLPHSRVDSLLACDIVDQGAANDSLFGSPNYMAEQIESWSKENPEIINTVLDTYFKNKENKTIAMSKEVIAPATEETNKEELATGIESVKSAISKLSEKVFGKKEEKEEVLDTEKVEVELKEIKEENESLSTKVEDKDKEIESLKADLEEMGTQLGTLSEKVEELSKIQLGTAIAPVGDEQNIESVATDAEKAAAKKLKRDEEILEMRQKTREKNFPQLYPTQN